MLRSFLDVCTTAETDAVISADGGKAALTGGGRGYIKPWHWHDCLMLILPSVGALDLKLEDRPEREGWVSEDRFLVVPAGRAHRSRAIRDNHIHVAVYVTGSALREVEQELGSLTAVRRKIKTSVAFKTTPEIRTLQHLCRQGHRHEFARPVARRHLSAALLVQCLAQIERASPLSEASRGGHSQALVSEIKAYVSAHASDTISLEALSERFGISRRHLTRLFREKTGVSISTFQQEERLAAARLLLEETDLPIGEVAFRVGYESGSALARIMQRVDGQAPQSFRWNMARSVER